MVNWLKLKQKLRKPILFGTCGATGCFVVALVLGEIFRKSTQPPPLVKGGSQAVLLLIDTSSSMTGSKLEEVKTAAQDFVGRQNLSQNPMAVLNFGGDVNVGSSLTKNKTVLQRAIASLTSYGGTNMSAALQAATTELQSTTGATNILIFTDGEPNSPHETLAAAQTALNQGINIVAVATGGADTRFLRQLTGDSTRVFYANSGNFDQAFRQAEKSIYNPLIIERGQESQTEGALYSILSQFTGTQPSGYNALRTGVWTAIIATGTGLALIIDQNLYQHRRLLSLKEATQGTVGSLVAGMTAGALGQLIYTPFLTMPILATGGQLLGWIALGTLLGGTMPFFIPNLKPKLALLGGSIGGVLGGGSFLLITGTSSVILGRLAGSAIVGFCIGLAIALLEVLSRETKLIVTWPTQEQTEFILGTRALVLGSDDNTDIYLPANQDYPPITAKIFQEEEKIIMEFHPSMKKRKKMKILRQELQSGSRRKLGEVILEVKTFDSN